MDNSDLRTGHSQGAVDRPVKIIAAVGYASFFCVLPLLFKKGNEYAQFHGRQSFVLFILEIVAVILKMLPFIGELVFTLALVVFGSLSLIGMTKAMLGEMWEMPIIYELSNQTRS